MPETIRQLSDEDPESTIGAFVEAISHHQRHQGSVYRDLIRQGLIGDPTGQRGFTVAERDGTVAGFIRWTRADRTECTYISLDLLRIMNPEADVSLPELLVSAAEQSALRGDVRRAIVYHLTVPDKHPVINWARQHGYTCDDSLVQSMAGTGQTSLRKTVLT